MPASSGKLFLLGTNSLLLFFRLHLHIFLLNRSRDMKILDTCDIVVDVGGVYDHSKKRYDHHMR